MNRRFSAGGLIVVSTLLTYFFIAILLTGEVALPVAVPLLVLVVWFLIYKLRYKNLGNLEVVKRIYSDLKYAIHRLKERLAENQAPRRAEASRRREALINREIRKTDTPKVIPVDKKYTDLIERRVREAKANQEQGEGANETES
jgi:hypothetical protein